MQPVQNSTTDKVLEKRFGGKSPLPVHESFKGVFMSVWIPTEYERSLLMGKAVVTLVLDTRVEGHPGVSMKVQTIELTDDDSDKVIKHKPPAKTDVRRVQELMMGAAREAAQYVSANIEGASLFNIILSETVAAVAVEMAATGTILTEPGGPDRLVKATLEPIEKMLRENIFNYLTEIRRGG